jgi:hypothetical protein
MQNMPHRPTAYRLRLPGPTAVPERVQQAIAQPLVNHRGPEAHALIAEIARRAKPIFGTANDILLFAASGTGVMEASLANVVAPGERVLVALNGQFGERFKAIAESMGAIVDGVDRSRAASPHATTAPSASSTMRARPAPSPTSRRSARSSGTARQSSSSIPSAGSAASRCGRTIGTSTSCSALRRRR